MSSQQPEGGASIRCFVADDHPAILEAVANAIDKEDRLALVGTARDGKRALCLLLQTRPDVALLDIRMPGLTGVEIARRLNSEGSTVAVILYTGEGDRALLLECLDAGARGFLLKDAPLEDLVKAVRTVAAGRTYVDRSLARTLTGGDATDRLTVLTKREREILRMLADGMRNDRIAYELSISALTVRTHIVNATRKLDADTRTQAVAEALRQSLIT